MCVCGYCISKEVFQAKEAVRKETWGKRLEKWPGTKSLALGIFARLRKVNFTPSNGGSEELEAEEWHRCLL